MGNGDAAPPQSNIKGQRRMTQAQRFDDSTPPAPKGTRFRASSGRPAHPGRHHRRASPPSKRRARPTPSREVFWNITHAVADVLRLRASAWRSSSAPSSSALRIWRLGKPQPVFNQHRRAPHQRPHHGRRHEPREERPLRGRDALAASTPASSSSLIVTALLALDDYLPLIFGQRRGTRLPQGRHLPRLQPRRRPLRRHRPGRRRDGGLPPLRRSRPRSSPGTAAPPKTRSSSACSGFVLFTGILVEGLRIARRRNPGGQRELVELVAGGLGGREDPRRRQRKHAARHPRRRSGGSTSSAAFTLLAPDGDDQVPPHRLRARERLPQAPRDARPTSPPWATSKS